MTDPVCLRRRTEADLEECVRALREVHERDRYPLRWPADPARWLSPEPRFAAWVAVAGEQLVGHLVLCPGERAEPGCIEAAGLAPEELILVSRLFVRPETQGRGVGALLLAKAVEQAQEHTLVPVLDVFGFSEAGSLYERQGWRVIGSEPWSGDARIELVFYRGPASVDQAAA